MENQHRAIKGYRELSAEEIELMNKIKTAGAELLALQNEVLQHLSVQQDIIQCGVMSGEDAGELERFRNAEPLRWAAIAKTDIQTGVMALVRAVAQPTDC